MISDDIQQKAGLYDVQYKDSVKHMNSYLNYAASLKLLSNLIKYKLILKSKM